MADKKYNIVKAATWYTIGNILIKGVSFFVLPIFTALMSTTDYGIYSVYTSYMTIFEAIVLLGLSTTVKVSKYSDKVDYDKYISTICCMPVIFTAIATLIINSFYNVFPFDLLMHRELWNFLMFTAATAAVSNILSAKLILDGDYVRYMVFSAICILSNVSVSLILCYTVFHSSDVYMARVYGMAISNLVGTLYLLLSSKVKLRLEKGYIKIALTWGIPLLFHTLATVVLTQTDRIIVKELAGFSASGIYSIAVTILTIPVVLQTSLDNALSPWIFEKLKTKDYATLRKTGSLIIYFFLVAIIELVLVSPEIIRIFTNEAYWGAIYSFVPLCFGAVGEVLYCIVVNVEYFNQKTRYMFYGTLMAVIVNIGLDILLISKLGFNGAAYATTFSKFLLFSFHLFISKIIDKNTVVPLRTIITVMVVSCITNFAVLTMVDLIYIRWLIFILIAVFSLMYFLGKKDEVLSALKR